MMYARPGILTGFVLLTGSLVSAQLSWKSVDSLFGPLPASVHVYYTNYPINSRPSIAYYISADLRDKKLVFNSDTGRLTPAGFYAKNHNPLVVVNGSFFNPGTFENLNLVIRNGRMLSQNVTALKSFQSEYYYYPTRSAFGISKNRKADVAWLFTDVARRWPYGFQKNPIIARGKRANPILADLNTLDEWQPWRMRTAIGGGPVLIQNGQIRITNQEEQVFPGDPLERTARTAIGYTKDNRLIILIVQGGQAGISEGATLLETAALMQSLSCVEALNLDGGVNSCVLVNGKETIKLPGGRQREIGSVFVIEQKKKSR
ncbi:MAG TPA: phosphodiester glycosidase family protein [Flavitalea sp.]|nr:phosphodiester glycosidase family protein [Flavitalea sp.]